MSPSATLKGFIRERAASLGFRLVGFAAVDGPAPGAGSLRRWLAEGRHGTMAWLERNAERRTDPTLVLPGAKTVVSVAMSYATPHRHSGAPGSGKISRYAWGDDYHDIVGRRLDALLSAVREFDPSVAGRAYVDTGPVMEKAWAERAGIGWIGKHTNLISREAGSWIFLGELLLTAEIEPDAPETDQCGACVLCIEACPTGAITGPRELDARLCISYATIEHRGPLPEDLRDRLDGWLYGCDVCQEVCPWNGAVAPTAEPGFAPRHGRAEIPLRDAAAMTDGEFRRAFRGSAVRRARPEGFRRNARALLGASAVDERGQGHNDTHEHDDDHGE